MRRFILLFLALTIVVGSFSSDAEARRRRRRHRTRRTQQIINEKKLYERLGGSKVIAEIVDEWTRLNFADSRVAAGFSTVTSRPDKLGKMRSLLNQQLCEISEGPCQYPGREMKKAHSGMAINEEQFLIVSDNLLKALQAKGISEREKNELMARIGDLQSEVVNENK